MAQTSIAVQTLTAAAKITENPMDGSNGNVFVLGGNANTILVLKNGDASPIVATIAGVGVCEYGSTHDLAITIPAGETWISPPLDVQRFQDPANSNSVTVSYTGTVTSSKISVIKLK